MERPEHIPVQITGEFERRLYAGILKFYRQATDSLPVGDGTRRRRLRRSCRYDVTARAGRPGKAIRCPSILNGGLQAIRRYGAHLPEKL